MSSSSARGTTSPRASASVRAGHDHVRRRDPLRPEHPRVRRGSGRAPPAGGARPSGRPRQRRERRRARRARARCRAGSATTCCCITLGTGIGGGDRDATGTSRVARTGSPPRSVTSRSTRTARCARAGSEGTGRPWHPASRSGAWAASAPPPVRRHRCSHAPKVSSTRSPACTWATPRRRVTPDALAIVHEYAQQVAVGLVGLVNILDSELVVISGGLVELGDVLLEPVREWFDGHLEGARLPSAGRHRPGCPRRAGGRGRRRRARAPADRGLSRGAPEVSDGEARITLPSFRDDLEPRARGRRGGGGRRPRRVFALRPPVPACRRRHAPSRARAAHGDGRGRRRDAVVSPSASFVARATLRPPAVLASGFDTAGRGSPVPSG